MLFFCILKYATIQDKTKIVKKRNFGEKILPHLLHDLTMKIGTSFFMSECAQSRFQSVIDLHFSTVFQNTDSHNKL